MKKQRHKLIKDWDSKRHGKIMTKGMFMIITRESELEELIEGEHIVAPKKKIKKPKKIKDNGSIDITTDN